MTRVELEKSIEELRTLKAMREELENEVKDIERKIINHMTENELEKEVTDSSVVTYKDQFRETIDKEALKKLLSEEEFEKVKKKSCYKVLRIK